MRPLRSTLPNELLQSCAFLAGLLLASVAPRTGLAWPDAWIVRS